MGQISFLRQAADQKARAFYLEYLNCGMETLFSADFESIYRRLDRYFIMDIDRSYDQLAAVSAAAHGVVLTMIFAYDQTAKSPRKHSRGFCLILVW